MNPFVPLNKYFIPGSAKYILTQTLPISWHHPLEITFLEIILNVVWRTVGCRDGRRRKTVLETLEQHVRFLQNNK